MVASFRSYWVILLVLLIASPVFAWTEITLQQGTNGYSGTTDAWLNESLTRDNYGGSANLRVQWYNGRSDCTVIKFDLTGIIPPNQRILSATLSLYYHYAGSMQDNNSMTIKPFRITQGAWWDENIYDGQFGYGVSYRYRDAEENYEWTNGAEGGWYDKIDDGNGTNKIKKAGGLPPDAIPPGNWVPFTVTSSVSQWYQGATNNGFLLVATGFEGSGTTVYGLFYSRNDGAPSWGHPKLTIRYEGALAPLADAGGPYSVGPGQSVLFDGTGSYDPDGGNITAWLWDLDNDGEFDDANGAQVNVSYQYLVYTLGLEPGEHTIGLKVIDDENDWDTDTAQLTIRPELSPIAEADGPYIAYPGYSVVFDGSGSYDPDGGDIVAWRWDLDNDGQYDDATGEYAEVSYQYLVETLGLEPGEHLVGLEVVDDEEDTGTDTAALVVVGETMPPVADAGGPYIAYPDQSVLFDGSGSYDPDGGDNDGQYDDATGEYAEVSYQYLVETLGLAVGDHVIGLEVIDDEYQTGTDTSLLRILPMLDFGDAPPPYPTLAASNGAVHVIVPDMYMGQHIDSEPDGQPEAHALGDDHNKLDDEDGVSLPGVLVPGTEAYIEITASSHGFLDAWIDFDGDGSWDQPEDQIFYKTEIHEGTNDFSILVPSSARPGIRTFARFRYSSTGGLSYSGEAKDGEVEDYEVKIQAAGWALAEEAQASRAGLSSRPSDLGMGHMLGACGIPVGFVFAWKRIKRRVK